MADFRLSAAAEAALVYEMQTSHNTSSRAWARLETAFKPLLTSYANRVGCNVGNRAEVEQDMRLAFLHAVRKHDPSKGNRLASLVHCYLKGAVRRTRKRLQNQKNLVSLDSLVEQAELSGGKYPLSDLGEASTNMMTRVTLQDEIIPAVRLFIDSRPLAQRQLALRIVDFGESRSEAAASLKVSRQAASKTWSRLMAAGRVELRQYL